MYKNLNPSDFTDYELIDSGDFEKLERFGSVVVRRPEPQSIWDKSLSDKEWASLASASFKKSTDTSFNPEDKGDWIISKPIPKDWTIQYNLGQKFIKFKLNLTSFKHVGIFPEQASNWSFIYNSILDSKVNEQFKMLNLFAYTGGATLAAKAAGADIYHVDSIKQVVSWAKENMEISNLNNVRWVVEDALKFVQREVNRNNKYNAIVLDPPAFGRGPKGEIWKLEKNLNEIMHLCNKLLLKGGFLILNLYSLGFSPLISDNIIISIFGDVKNKELGELFVQDKAKRKLPLGTYCRFVK